MRKCVYLVRRDHFRSRDKDGGHTIRSAVADNPMLHANFTALSSIELELLPIEVSHCGNHRVCVNRRFRPFCYCDLDLDPTTFIYELDPYPLILYLQTKNELYTSRLSKVIVLHTYRQTDRRHRNYYHASWRVITKPSDHAYVCFIHLQV